MRAVKRNDLLESQRPNARLFPSILHNFQSRRQSKDCCYSGSDCQLHSSMKQHLIHFYFGEPSN